MVFVYLARRDKRGMKLLTTLNGPDLPPTRLENLAQIVPIQAVDQLTKVIHEDRMMYEPWVESAASFEDLKRQMRKRGYTRLPASTRPTFNYNEKVVHFQFDKLPKTKTMTRRQRGK
jgi:hypothetical protein